MTMESDFFDGLKVVTYRQCGAQKSGRMGSIAVTDPETGCRVTVEWVHPDDMGFATRGSAALCFHISRKGWNNIDDRFSLAEKAKSEEADND